MSARSRGRGGPPQRRVATVQRRGRFLVAEPIFERGPRVALDRRAKVGAGQMALIELGPGRARALRELGSPDRARDVVDALLLERAGGRGFAEAIERDAASSAERAGAGGARRNLTDLATFTVDPATARDFDDAVSAHREGDGVRLWIHIADVAAHVAPGSALDREASRRGNSTYVPGTVEPMLPRALSAGACSLSAGAERLAVTTEIELGAAGEVRSVSFYRSRIRSDARLDYDQLDEVFAGRAKPPDPAAEPLEITRSVASGLAARPRSGALEVHSAEPEFQFDGDGNVTAAHSVEGTEAHRLIEQLMILCNEQVASLLESKKVPTLYRVHEQPDPERVAFMVEQLASLDLPTPQLPERLAPREAAMLAAEASRMVAAEAARRGHGREAYTSLVLRALRQAHYSERNFGHAGLASPAYCHFTSPIRRYPDLLVHRGLLSGIGEGENPPAPDLARDAAVSCSEREREAAVVERDADDVCAAFLLERELFESGWDTEFEAEVSGVIGAGAFVRFGGKLGDVYEGFVPARRLRGERFELNQAQTALIGTKTGRAVRFGDPISVRVERIEAPRGRVDLEPEG
ncbi:MAG: RNB domain-containing ribonuclease [Solirubrobacterales bacterium]